MGENYIVFSFGDKSGSEANSTDKNENIQDSNPGGSINDNIINVKIFSGEIRHEILTFTPSKSPFTIGRSADCDIPIEDGMLSRIHSTIQFINGQWYINDGQILDNGGMKKSTNGTWIYCLEDTPITEGTTFKANHNLFICSFTTPNGNTF